MTKETERLPAAGKAIRSRLESALLAGDRAAVERLSVNVPLAAEWKDSLLAALTRDCLDGRVPFSQLTAAAQAACLFCDDQALPVACCGAIAGNTSAAGRDYMMMLLRAWGVPTIDLGVDVPEAAFISAVVDRGVRFVVCTVFSQADFTRVRQLDRQARALGIRDRFHLLISGAQMEHGDGPDLASDCPDHRAAAIAEWVVRTWKA